MWHLVSIATSRRISSRLIIILLSDILPSSDIFPMIDIMFTVHLLRSYLWWLRIHHIVSSVWPDEIRKEIGSWGTYRQEWLLAFIVLEIFYSDWLLCTILIKLDLRAHFRLINIRSLMLWWCISVIALPCRHSWSFWLCF